MSARNHESWSLRAPAAALALVVFGLAVPRPAAAQAPVIFEGQNPFIISVSEKLNGVAQNPSLVTSEINQINNPAFLVLFPNGTFGFIASGQAAGTTLFPVYGQLTALPNGWLQFIGRTNTMAGGAATSTAFVGGVIFVANGKFYAVTTMILTVSLQVQTPNGTVTNVTVDVGQYLLPLTVIR